MLTLKMKGARVLCIGVYCMRIESCTSYLLLHRFDQSLIYTVVAIYQSNIRCTMKDIDQLIRVINIILLIK